MVITATRPPTAHPAPGLVSVDGRQFPLRSTEIRATADGGLAETRLIQTYENPHEEPLEVLYTMPLPADGAVVGYIIKLGDRVITGEIERLEAARKAYQKALEEGRTAGLLEQLRADTFMQKLGSLPAGATAQVEIRILHLLAFRAQTDEVPPSWEYRFPTVVGVRYEGAPGRVPDAEHLDVDRAAGDGTGVRVQLDLKLARGTAESLQPTSPSHEIRLAQSDDACSVQLHEAARLDRDLVVRWRATQPEVGVNLVEGAGLPGDGGRYALLTITPPTTPAATFARDLTILIDASGSMTGQPLATCKEVVEALLASLGPRDRFEIKAFASSVQDLVNGPAKADRSTIQHAITLLRALQAGGTTEMAGAMIAALQPLKPDAQRQVILLTDGDIGFEHEVVGQVMRRLQPGCRVHVVGVGAAPNRTLTRGVARAGRGSELFISTAESARDAASRLLQATVAPVLADLSIGGSACSAFAPAHLRDVLAGQPLVAAVELNPRGGRIEVRGKLAGDNEPRTWTIEVPARPTPTTSLPIGALFGREAVEDQELQLAVSKDRAQSAAIESTIETLGLRHRITSRRTSLVAICDEPTVDPTQPRRRRKLELELPAGVSAEGVGLLATPVPSAGISLDMCIGYRAAPGRAADIDDFVAHALGAPPVRRLRERLKAPFARPGTTGDRSSRETPFATVAARLVRADSDLIVIEFESPRDGFVLPVSGAALRVLCGPGDEFGAEPDTSLSTHAGPHAAGLTLRLALRRTDGTGWAQGKWRISWHNADGRECVVTVGSNRSGSGALP